MASRGTLTNRKSAWRQNLALASLVLALVAALGCSCLGDSQLAGNAEKAQLPPFGELSPSEAFALIQANQDNPSFVIVDARTSTQFARNHIAGAINVPSGKTFEQDISQLDKSFIYLVYCQSAMLSGDVVETMKELGFTKIYELSGGLFTWQKRGYEIFESDLESKKKARSTGDDKK